MSNPYTSFGRAIDDNPEEEEEVVQAKPRNAYEPEPEPASRSSPRGVKASPRGVKSSPRGVGGGGGQPAGGASPRGRQPGASPRMQAVRRPQDHVYSSSDLRDADGYTAVQTEGEPDEPIENTGDEGATIVDTSADIEGDYARPAQVLSSGPRGAGAKPVIVHPYNAPVEDYLDAANNPGAMSPGPVVHEHKDMHQNLHQQGKDWVLERATKLLPRQFLPLFFEGGAAFNNIDKWTACLLQLFEEKSLPLGTRVEVAELLALNSFRNTIEVAQLHQRDEEVIRWLAQLYLGQRVDDNQVGNLPYRIKDQDNLSLELRVNYLWGHLHATLDTLSKLRDFYHAGYVHLMSRKEAASHATSPGQYLFRLSNKEPGEMIITTNTTHIYLTRAGLKKAGCDVPRGVVVHSTIYVGHRFEITQWTIDGLKDFLNKEGRRLGLRTPLMGAIPISGLDAGYTKKVKSEYEHFKTIEGSYMSFDPKDIEK